MKTEIQSTHLAKEEEVRVFTNTNYSSFDAKGKIIWTSDIKGELGIKFTQLGEEKRKSLEDFLKLLP